MRFEKMFNKFNTLLKRWNIRCSYCL